MVMLTEEMVIVRTKQSNIGAITKLNFWGSQLSDVSILRKMTNVVVLSLSVNNIDTLADMQFCKLLQDLFIRKNNIKDLNEVCYLKDLNQLKSLWLDENPCCTGDGYRLAVIKALPQLQKFDNIVIENSESARAQAYGKTLYRPDQIAEYYYESDEEDYEKNYIRNKEERCSSPEILPAETHSNNYSPDPQIQNQRERGDYVQHNSYENEQNVLNDVNNRENLSTGDQPVPPPRTFKSDEQPESHHNHQKHYSTIPRSRTTDGEFASNDDWKRRNCQGSTCCVQAMQKRPNERRTNVLNAVLCLIKELDYPNLEVVQMAVKCRMEELSDEI